jgi:protein-tyrosine-phosphatase
MNILFVCKYNRFRSRIAESYFNKINSNPNLKARSGGIIVGSYPLDKREVRIAEKFGIILKGKPEPITTEKLVWQDIIVIVANNVPPSVFNFNKKRFNKKVIVWKVPDICSGESMKRIEQIIKLIKRQVEVFLKDLK